MSRRTPGRWAPAGLVSAAFALSLVLGAAPAHSATNFPALRSWALVGAFQDSSVTPRGIQRCQGALGVRPDSLRIQPRTITLRFLRDREAELRPDFGGYRIYRMIGTPDTTHAVLVRRYSVNEGSDLSWHFSRVNPATLEFECQGAVVGDSIVSFVDPDSSGNWTKVCRRTNPQGLCASVGDSIWALVAPPGPHDGFRTYYAITYEARNGADANYEDAFIPDTLDGFARCGTPGDRTTCPNLNNKLANLVGPIEPTGGPTANLRGIGVVPNPFRASAPWDATTQKQIHFINLPSRATIRIFTVSGDLVRELHHEDAIRDYEIWDLQSGAGKDVASGIYMFQVVAGNYTSRGRFVVIR
jgi:hypothetical protein